MKVLDELMKVERAAFENVDGSLRVAATLSARRNSAVYSGHFPSTLSHPACLCFRLWLNCYRRPPAST